MKGSLRFLMYVVITSDLRTGDLLPEEWPGVLHPDAVVDELDVVDDDPHEGLLPLYGGQDRPILAVQDDPVALDTLGNCRSELAVRGLTLETLTELHGKLFELFTLLEQQLEVIPDEVDALLQELLEVELVGEPQDGDAVGEVEVPHHELHAPCVQLLGLEVV